MKTYLALLTVIGLGCSSPQTQQVVADVTCSLADVNTVVGILEGPGSTEQKLVTIIERVGPDIMACVMKNQKAELQLRAKAKLEARDAGTD